ncbi:MAG: caspase family protein [Bacteroidota bacterium]
MKSYHCVLTSIHLLLALALAFPSLSQTMTQTWEQSVEGKGNEQINHIIEATNGHLMAVGKSSTQSAGGEDGLLVKLDFSTGSIIERKQFGGKKGEEFKSIVQTFDGGFLLAGFTETNAKGKKDAWLVAVDEHGELLWEQASGGKENDSWECIDLLPDGSLVLAGYKDGVVCVAKMLERKLVWETIIGKGRYDNITGMAIGADGGVVLTGNTRKSSARRAGDIWLAKVDAAGRSQWERFFGEKGWEEATDVIYTQDGGYAISGLTRSKGAGDLDAWVVKVGRDGFRQWEKTFGGKDADLANGLAQTDDGGFLIVGSTKSHRKGARHPRILVVKTDAGGYRQWEQNFGSDKKDVGKSVCRLFDGSMVAAGTISGSGDDGWLARFSDPYNGNSALAGAREVLQVSAGQVTLHTNDGQLKPSERTYLSFQLENKSSIDISNVQVSANKTTASSDFALWTSNYIGRLKAGESRVVRIPVQGGSQLNSAEHTVALSVFSGSKQLQNFQTVIQSKSPKPANLELGDFRFVDSKNSDDIQLVVKVDNTGDFPTQKVNIHFIHPDQLTAKSPAIQSLGGILPLSSKESTFAFRPSAQTDKKLGIVCVISENGQEKVRKTINWSAAGGSNPLAGGPIMIWTDPAPHELGTNKINRSEDQIEFKMTVVSGSPLQPEDFRLRVNGSDMEGSKFDEEDLSPPKKSDQQYTYTYRNKVPLKRGVNQLQVAVSGQLSQTLEVNFEPRKGNLHLLTIGPNHPDLKYTSKDAADIAEAFRQQSGPDKLFANVFTRKLNLPEQTTLTSIQQSVYDLVYQYKDQLITDNDVLLVFISSHGKVSQNRFKILQSNYNSKYEHISIDFKTDIIDPLAQIDCKKIVFLDACHSGAASSKSDFANLSQAVIDLAKAQPGLATLTSCRSTELSYEDQAWENGAFTEALLEAFSNKLCTDENGSFQADTNKDGIIRLQEVYSFLQRRVPNLVKSQLPNAPTTQVPYMPENQFDRDIPLYRLD